MPFRYEEFDLSGVRTYPLASRQSKAKAEDFAKPVARGGSFKNWFDSLPSILGAADVRRVVEAGPPVWPGVPPFRQDVAVEGGGHLA